MREANALWTRNRQRRAVKSGAAPQAWTHSRTSADSGVQYAVPTRPPEIAPSS